MTTKFGLVAIVFGLFLMGGCKGPTYPNCKNDSQCKIGPAGEALSGVCVFGKCEECAMNSDCTDGKQCVDNKCMMPCTSDDVCGSGNHCQDGFCHANCTDNSSCGAGRACNAGRCTADGASCATNTDCVSGYQCVQGACRSSACANGGTVHFDFNKSNIRSEDMSTLNDIGMCLRNNAGVNVVVEGNTDERGTTEYNMHLGQSRADSVSKYLVNQGVAKSRIKAISYGEEKPVDPASNEAAWAKNRRSDIVPQ